MDTDTHRFQSELEFVQSLSNVMYLHFLASRHYFDNPKFINYLSYLQYWKKDPYIKYILYPQSLYILDCLQHEQFRKACSSPAFLEALRSDIMNVWRLHDSLHEGRKCDDEKIDKQES
ncbi:hypothetical protein RCL1_004036 [Eukaryota sp. TZLM3-RCL]